MEEPISKNQILSQLSDEVKAALTEAVKIINRRLQNFNDGETVSVNMSLFCGKDASFGFERRVATEIKKLYESKGWKVSFFPGDQREPEATIQIS